MWVQKENFETAQMTFTRACDMRHPKQEASAIGLIWKRENITFMWECLIPPAGMTGNVMQMLR